MPKSEITNELLEQAHIARRRRFRHPNGKAGLVLTMAIAADGIFCLAKCFGQTAYEKGDVAYQAADCSTVVQQFERFINSNPLVDFNSLLPVLKPNQRIVFE